MGERRGICIIGIGNPDRGDDAAGRLVARRLRDDAPSGIAIVECDGEMAELVDLLGRAEGAILVDAGSFGAPPGTVRRLDAGRECIPAAAASSSHGLGMAQAIEMARALGRLPPRCIIYLIEGSAYDIGAPPSDAVVAAIPDLVAMIRREVGAALSPAGLSGRPRTGSDCSVPTDGTGRRRARR